MPQPITSLGYCASASDTAIGRGSDGGSGDGTVERERRHGAKLHTLTCGPWACVRVRVRALKKSAPLVGWRRTSDVAWRCSRPPSPPVYRHAAYIDMCIDMYIIDMFRRHQCDTYRHDDAAEEQWAFSGFPQPCICMRMPARVCGHASTHERPCARTRIQDAQTCLHTMPARMHATPARMHHWGGKAHR